MVRFSDIIKDKDSKKPKKNSPDTSNEQGDSALSNSQIARVLSDSQISMVRGEKALFAPPFKEEWSGEVTSHYEKFVDRAIDIRARVRNDQGISPSPILSDLHNIHDKDLVGKLYEYSMLVPNDYEWIVVHNVHVMFLSMLVGQEMAYDMKMLLKLGLAALLENVGMYKIPESVLEKKGTLDDKEMAEVREHPKNSYDILAQMGEKYQWLAEVAVQVHERTDGSGYPYGLKGAEIYDLSSTIGIADVYLAMTSDRPYREKILQTDAAKYILKEAKEQFPSKIRKIFMNQISFFPVNSYVLLNNKSLGRVLTTDKQQPLRPTIEVLYDGTGKKMEKTEVIKLAENPLIYITESINEKDLP
ncbi:MAG: HD domain-containing phosphohydrolase [Desulfobacteraceae bacterium]|jgi:HD-GYP domain-containing protein (c-di-GMP phosphodiesterase class II)